MTVNCDSFTVTSVGIILYQEPEFKNGTNDEIVRREGTLIKVEKNSL